MPAKRPAVVAPNAQLVTVRTQGFQLTSPLQELRDNLDIVDNESYLEADALVGRIRNARAIWKTKMDPILSPLKRAIDEAKLAMTGATTLYKEIDDPLDILERDTKKLMAEYKVEERRLIAAAQEEAAAEERRLLAEAQALTEKAFAARTPQMRSKLEQRRAELEAQAQVVSNDAAEIVPVKGTSSSDRTIKKVRITNLMAFLRSIEDYEPQAEVYKMGHPPSSLLDTKMFQVALNKIFSSQPGVVASWPGVETYDDITIAGR